MQKQHTPYNLSKEFLIDKSNIHSQERKFNKNLDIKRIKMDFCTSLLNIFNRFHLN
ncbi:hypothetical protein KIS1582_2312 [Cytobacillus firmus]|uniref:Uncharacterized protein n=1 Tax=Cytobacillus firmus TaxID=1399 RepID=A0A800MWT5_CYTFI|nr:hypothetical protein KIS1582_2312 [Cytobacillus firmus]